MADDPKPFQVVDGAHAPFIFFDGVPTFGTTWSNVKLTLAAYRDLPLPDGSVASDVVIVAHLRCTREAAITLRDSIDKALLLGASTPTTAKN